MKNLWTWVLVIVVAIVIIVAIVIYGGKGNNTDNTNTQITQPPTTVTVSEVSTDNAVSISNFTFNPQIITVRVGTTVTWTNEDSVAHQIVSDTGAPLTGINSPTLNNGDSFNFTFTQAGTWSYHCSIHPDMLGQVEVIN